MSHEGNGRPTSPAAPKRLEILRIKEGYRWAVRSLAPVYGGLFTHWVGNRDHGRSFLCEGEDCKRCRNGLDLTWKGYYAGEAWHQAERYWLPCVVELTESAELDVRGRFGRGVVFTFNREKQTGKKREPVHACFVEIVPEAELPPCFDVEPVLRSVYHVRAVDLSIKNPVPDRIFIEPTQGGAPGSYKKNGVHQR